MKVVIGQGSCGIATGAKKTSNAFEQLVAEKGLTDVVIDKTGCIGTCYLEPIVDVYNDEGDLETRYVRVQPDKVAEIVEKHLIGKTPVEELAISDEDKNFLDQQQRVVLRNCGNINPEKIDEYIAVGGYEGLKKVVTSMTQDEVIQVIKDAGLRGRGGAGFPTWFKWNAAKQSPGTEKYKVGGQAVLGRQIKSSTPWLTERHGYDPTSERPWRRRFPHLVQVERCKAEPRN